MSKDLLRRKKRRFLKAGGLNPPADLASPEFAPEDAGGETSAPEADTEAAPAEAGAAAEFSAAGDVPPEETAEEEKQDTAPEEEDDGLDLVFADILGRRPEYEDIPASPFYLAGKAAVAVFVCVMGLLTFAYNMGYTDILNTEIQSFVTRAPQESFAGADDVLTPEPATGEDGENAFSTVFITCDGETAEYAVRGDVITVGAALEQAGISLQDEDIVEPTAESVITDMGSVTVTRIKHVEYTETVRIPASTDIKPTPLLRAGRQREVDSGVKRDGEKQVTYRDEYIDGELVSHEVVDETVTRAAVNSTTLEGAAVSMSPINGARFTDVLINDNAPESYEKMIRGYCTAYHFKKGCWGASGMYLSQGFIAADPDVIPYGSLVYITNSDGSMVYGWAICADYCEAAAQGRISVDLFFDTYLEPLLWGKHTMNIYVVGQLYQDDLQDYVARQGYFNNRVPARPSQNS